jgi:hypothetical protein
MSSSMLSLISSEHAAAIAPREKMLPPGVPGGSDVCHHPSLFCRSIERVSMTRA